MNKTIFILLDACQYEAGTRNLAYLEHLPLEEKKNLMDGFRKVICLLAVVLVLFYGYYANVNYTAVYFVGEQIDNYLSGVVVKATMTEGYTTDKQWAILGDAQDPLFGCPWEDEITYTGLGFTQYILNQYSQGDWIENYIGYDLPMVSEEAKLELAAMDEVKSMPCYPNAGSIRIVEDTVVVKFQDITA